LNESANFLEKLKEIRISYALWDGCEIFANNALKTMRWLL
jgi:hypothetical protein